jgi:hypothetical protein
VGISRDAKPVWEESGEDDWQPASRRQAIKMAHPGFMLFGEQTTDRIEEAPLRSALARTIYM